MFVGKVIHGDDVLDTFEKIPVDHKDRPVHEIKLTKVTIHGTPAHARTTFSRSIIRKLGLPLLGLLVEKIAAFVDCSKSLVSLCVCVLARFFVATLSVHPCFLPAANPIADRIQ